MAARPLELRFRIVYIICTHVFIFFVLGEQIMTDYQKMYQEKLTTPDKIAQQVQSGWLLGMDTATSQTPAIMTAIAEHIRNSDIIDLAMNREWPET
jgi:hypothetical protein